MSFPADPVNHAPSGLSPSSAASLPRDEIATTHIGCALRFVSLRQALVFLHWYSFSLDPFLTNPILVPLPRAQCLRSPQQRSRRRPPLKPRLIQAKRTHLHGRWICPKCVLREGAEVRTCTCIRHDQSWVDTFSITSYRSYEMNGWHVQSWE